MRNKNYGPIEGMSEEAGHRTDMHPRKIYYTDISIGAGLMQGLVETGSPKKALAYINFKVLSGTKSRSPLGGGYAVTCCRCDGT